MSAEQRPFIPVRIAVLTVSDTRSLAEDRSGQSRAQVGEQQVEASLQVIHDFRHVTHVSALIDLLRPRL